MAFSEHIVCLPVPEKAQAQYSFCVFPLHGDGVIVPSEGDVAAEQILWTVPITPPKPGMIEAGKAAADESYKSVLLRLLNEGLRRVGKKVIEPSEKEFASKTVQAYRNGEKAVHVKAFRGSKEGRPLS